MPDKDGSPPRAVSPLRPMVVLAVSVFAFDALIMPVLAALFPLPGIWAALADAVFLTVLVFPVLYFSGFRPMVRMTKAREEELGQIRRLSAVLAAVRGVNRIISRGSASDRIIRDICRKLIATRGYHGAWIALLGPDGKISGTASAGMGDAYSALTRMLSDGDLPPCTQKARARAGVRVIEDPSTACAPCPVPCGYGGRSVLSARLESGGTVYGVLTLSVPRKYAHEKEEHDLLEEMAGDIGFALRGIEAEKQRKAAEAALTASEEKYRLLVEHADEAIFIVQDGCIRFHNPATARLAGHPPDELEGMPFSRLIHPEDRNMVSERHYKRIKGEDVPAGYRFRVVNKSGEKRWAQITSTLTTWEGKPATLNFIRDITGEKKLEDQLRQAQKMEAVGVLAGGVAHDFNNILTTIMGNAELALMELHEGSSLHEGITEIRKASERAVSLTRQLLAFSRKQVIQPRIIDLNETLKNMEKMLRRLIGEDIQMEAIYADDIWNVYMDPSQVEQVVMNLAVNARDAMPEGGRLILESANVVLDRAYFRDHAVESAPGDYVMLSVTDTGAGIDPKVRPRIFEPFFTTKEPGHGTGLGLSTVYGIVKQNHGFVWVYSEPGQGATFKVYLPRREGEAGAAVEARPSVKQLRGTETILVAEDDEKVLDITRRMLKGYGYRVLTAGGAHEAIRVFAGHDGPIHLLLTDVVMPEMDGRDLTKRLREKRPDLRALYMSGYTGNVISRRKILDADVEFIQKPFTGETLAKKVREVLSSGKRDKVYPEE